MAASCSVPRRETKKVSIILNMTKESIAKIIGMVKDISFLLMGLSVIWFLTVIIVRYYNTPFGERKNCCYRSRDKEGHRKKQSTKLLGSQKDTSFFRNKLLTK